MIESQKTLCFSEITFILFKSWFSTGPHHHTNRECGKNQYPRKWLTCVFTFNDSPFFCAFFHFSPCTLEFSITNFLLAFLPFFLDICCEKFWYTKNVLLFLLSARAKHSDTHTVAHTHPHRHIHTRTTLFGAFDGVFIYITNGKTLSLHFINFDQLFA